jgi:hypothetical protein
VLRSRYPPNPAAWSSFENMVKTVSYILCCYGGVLIKLILFQIRTCNRLCSKYCPFHLQSYYSELAAEMESDDSQTVVPKNTPSAQDPLADVDSRLSKACMKIMADIRDENGFLVRSHDLKLIIPRLKHLTVAAGVFCSCCLRFCLQQCNFVASSIYHFPLRSP